MPDAVTSIPKSVADLEAMRAEVDRQNRQVSSLFERLTPEVLAWRSAPDRWSVSGHVAHLALVNGPYLATLRPCLDSARARGRLSDGPYRHPWFARWFANSMEPPPRMRTKTLKVMVPDPTTGDPLADFLATQAELADALAAARGLDLGRARFSSPFLKILRFSAGTGLHLMLAHNRRHLWLIDEVMDSEGFPAPGAG